MFEIWSAQFNLLKKWAAEKFNLKDFTFAGQYDAGTAAIAAGALEPSVSKIITEKSVTSFNLCRSKPFAAAITMALMVQDILKYCDIPELAALANTEIEFISPIEADGTLLAPERFTDFANQCSSAVTRLKSTTGITMV